MAARIGELNYRVKSLEMRIIVPDADLKIYDCDGNLLFDLRELMRAGYKEQFRKRQDRKQTR